MVWIGAINFSTATNTSSSAQSNIKEYQQSATLDQLVVTVV